MKNRIIRSLLVFVMMTVSVPMWTQDYLKIYFKDGRTERHFMHLVKSISATKYDLEGNLHTDYQMQQIVMQDTTYSYYLADIDSMAFRKVYEEQVSNRVQSVQSSLEPIFQKYSNLEDLVSHIDEIKSIDGIENVHYDGNDLFIQIRDWFDVCISRQPKPENIFSFGDLLSRKNVRQLVPTSKDGFQMKVTIGFQMENDIDFASSKQITEDLSHDFTIMDYETEYSLGEELDIDFFYRRIFDSNVLLIDTHGGCGLFNNKHYLYTGIKADHAWTTKLGLSVLRELGVDVNNVDLDDIGISSCSYNDGDFWDSEFGMRWYWTVKEDFIRKSPYRFKGSGPHVVFIAACSSLKGNDILTRSDNVHPYGSKSFAQVFFDKGADVYLGYNSGSRLSSGAAVTFYDYMMHGASVEQAFKHLLPGYKEENTPENALLVDLYNELSDNPQGIFIVNTHTMEKTEQEVLREYKETGQLKLKGETSICPSKHELYNSNYDFINYGFRLAKEPNVDTLKPGQYEEYMSDGLSRLATMTGLSEFSVEIIPYLGKTYYRAFTFDGIHYNWGEEKSYTITVLTLSEKLVSLEAGWTQSVTIYSGSGNYKVESDNEKVATVFVYDNLISINALSAGDATITVTDTKTGLTEIIEVTVTASLQLSATELTLIAGNNGTIEITLGSGEYGVTNLNSDIAKATLEGTTITINALAAGEAKVVVTDMQSGQQVVIDVTVNANSDIKSFSLGITELEMPVGEVRSISIRRGSGDFRVTNHNPDIAKGMIFESVYMPYYLEVEAFKPGTALIDVEDQKSGDVIQLTVTVTEGAGNPDNPDDFIISFSNPKLKEVCVYNWDTNDDGEVSKAEAAAVTNIIGRMSFNVYKDDITSFDELQYFTGLTNIGDFAFSGLYKLTSIIIPDGVVTIGKYAFERCSSLTSVIIPNSVTTIGASAFQSCDNLASISIPSSVTYISERAFCGSGLTSIIIPNSISRIVSETFYDCRNLTSVTIPNSVTRIGMYAFWGCSRLTSITIPNSVTEIGSYAFCSTGLTSITIPNSVTSIVDNTFGFCSSLTSVNIPNSVMGIGSEAFIGCSGLTSITIPKSVNRIGKDAFFDCTSLQEVISYIEDPFAINDRTFSKYKEPDSGEIEFSSATLYVPKGCKPMYEATKGWMNFQNIVEMKSDGPGNAIIPFADPIVKAICVSRWDTNEDGELSRTELAAVTDLGETFIENHEIVSFNELQYFTGLTRIGYRAFTDCTSLSSISIPDNVISIDDEAFRNCSSLASITIPNSVTRIGMYAFWGCSRLTSITIPNSVTEIGSHAFHFCEKLTSINFGNSLKSIGNSAFQGCVSLLLLIIPNSVTTIGDGAFAECSSLTSVTIPNSVTTIFTKFFFGMKNLKEIYSYIEEPFEIDGSMSDCAFTAILYVPAGTKAKYEATEGWKNFKNIVEMGGETPGPDASIISFADPKVKAICVANWDTNGDGELSKDEAAAVTDLGEVFKENEEITSFDELQYFTGLSSIGKRAFFACTGLATIRIPNSVKIIDTYSFQSCKSLVSVTIPKGVTSIASGAFWNCTSLTSIDVDEGNSVYVSENGILFDKNLTTIMCYPNGKPENTYIIPNSVAIIGDWAFTESYNLTTIIIPESVISIGKYAFAHCYELTSIIIGNSVASIGENAFQQCNNLNSLTIPSSVTKIEGCAFEFCDNLSEVISYINEPFTINNNVFLLTDRTHYSNAILYVPAGTKAKYEATEGWKNFKNIVEMGGDDDPVSQQEIDKLNAELDNLIAQIRDVWGKLYNKTFGEEKRFTADIYGKLSEVSMRLQQCRTMLSVVKTQKEMESLKAEVASIAELLSTAAQQTEAFSLSFGDTFVAASAEGIELKFTVLSAQEKTCLVGDMSQQHSHSALTNIDQTGSVTVPATVNYKGETYKVTEIGPGAFSSCRLSFINIPSVSHIWMNAFWYSQITEITIPESVTGMGPQIFSRCSQLKKVTCLIKEPFVIDASMFDGIPADATLYVPAGTKARYEATEGWNQFKNIVEMGGETPGPEPDVNSQNLCPDDNHPHLIDLGLPNGAKMACSNEGAAKPEETGDAYTWDEAMSLCQNKGYRLLTEDEIRELVHNCGHELMAINGVKGQKIKASNGNVVFLPFGDYWSCEVNANGNPYYMYVKEDVVQWANVEKNERKLVRPVYTTGGETPGPGGDIIAYTSCPDDNHPHMIDLGLPSGTKWACCNVGANKPEECGDYYAFGETEKKNAYYDVTYQYYDSSKQEMMLIGNYIEDPVNYPEGGYYDISGTDYDAATVHWGAPWQMPTMAQFRELVTNTTSEMISKNGERGQEFTGPNGRTIFLPYAGEFAEDHQPVAGYDGNYWASQIYGISFPWNCECLNMHWGTIDTDGICGRWCGLSIRPVVEK